MTHDIIGGIMSQSKLWSAVTWGGVACSMLACVTLLSPVIASQSLAPWILYSVGNLILLVDSVINRQIPWIAVTVFFSVWNVLILLSRAMGIHILQPIMPLVQQLEQILI